METILRRSVSNTRLRDFYDIYLIVKTLRFNPATFRKAFSYTAAHRGSTEQIKNIPKILQAIKESSMLKQHWEKYRHEYSYARNITFEDMVNVLYKLVDK